MEKIYKYLLWFAALCVLMAAILSYLPTLYPNLSTSFPQLSDFSILLTGIGIASTIIALNEDLNRLKHLTKLSRK